MSLDSIFKLGQHDNEFSTRESTVMIHYAFFNPLEKALRFYTALALAIVLFQCLGLMMYLVNVWPTTSNRVSGAATLVLGTAVVLGLFRSCVWILIYWKGARALSLLRTEADSVSLGDRLAPILSGLTYLLIASCVLDVLFLPAYFLSDAFLPFSVAGWRLGVVELARILFPQAFGLAALVLAFLTHHYGQLLKERGRMQHELDLTI